MTDKKKQTTYLVNSKITVDSYVEIQAADFDDAVNQAKQLRLEDFVQLNGEVMDTSFRMTGVYE